MEAVVTETLADLIFLGPAHDETSTIAAITVTGDSMCRATKWSTGWIRRRLARFSVNS
jgi:hypothetical protein